MRALDLSLVSLLIMIPAIDVLAIDCVQDLRAAEGVWDVSVGFCGGGSCGSIEVYFRI